MNIYVGKLSPNITANNLQSMFEEFGSVESVKIIMDHRTGRPKGFGFVEMPSNSEADQAIKALNNKFMEGQTIKVNPADPGGKKSKKKSLKRRR